MDFLNINGLYSSNFYSILGLAPDYNRIININRGYSNIIMNTDFESDEDVPNLVLADEPNEPNESDEPDEPDEPGEPDKPTNFPYEDKIEFNVEGFDITNAEKFVLSNI